MHGLILLICLAPILTLIFGMVVGGHLEARRQHSLQSSASNASGDDDVLAYLEASMVDSPLAHRLLIAAKKLDGIADPARVLTMLAESIEYASSNGNPSPAKWQNNGSIDITPEKHWELFIRQFEMEVVDEDKIDVLSFHRERGYRFTHWEQTEILSRLETEEARKQARKLFLTQEGNQKINAQRTS